MNLLKFLFFAMISFSAFSNTDMLNGSYDLISRKGNTPHDSHCLYRGLLIKATGNDLYTYLENSRGTYNLQRVHRNINSIKTEIGFNNSDKEAITVSQSYKNYDLNRDELNKVVTTLSFDGSSLTYSQKIIPTGLKNSLFTMFYGKTNYTCVYEKISSSIDTDLIRPIGE